MELNSVNVGDIENLYLTPAQLFVAQLGAYAALGRRIELDQVDAELEYHYVSNVPEDLMAAARFGAALQITGGNVLAAADWLLDEGDRINLGIEEGDDPLAEHVSAFIENLSV